MFSEHFRREDFERSVDRLEGFASARRAKQDLVHGNVASHRGLLCVIVGAGFFQKRSIFRLWFLHIKPLEQLPHRHVVFDAAQRIEAGLERDCLHRSITCSPIPFQWGRKLKMLGQALLQFVEIIGVQK
ncbi:hypothetical protein GFL09_13140 [Pseudomonas stutzeri]|uniref:hypothetical protein n=1 Tax=Stutzerimonas stutzeri TaxID=316 RepID=UPI00190C2DAA|nr:hypothetical protein [Stutzerimonas stutzeri]MBK3868626.1 hypothetical protein [Stutzerimonas stutzeri]